MVNNYHREPGEQPIPRERKSPGNPVWFLVPVCVIGFWLVMGLCVVVSSVAGTVWLVRQAFGV